MKTTRLLSVALLSALAVLTGCASGYKQFYQPANDIDPQKISELRVAPPPSQPIIERAHPGNPDEVLKAYAKRGYIMIGSSMFNSGRSESEDAAVRQGQEVHADLVLILNPNYTGSVTSSIPITTPTTSTTYSNATATAYGRGGPVTAYGSGTSTTYGTATNYIPMTVNRVDYGAVYFIKRKFTFGAFYRDLNDAERQELQTNRGSVARLIVDGTPAFNADILIGDVFITLDGVAIANSQALSELLGEKKGKTITLSILRRGQSLDKTLQLNL
jgi:PDZ domain